MRKNLFIVILATLRFSFQPACAENSAAVILVEVSSTVLLPMGGRPLSQEPFSGLYGKTFSDFQTPWSGYLSSVEWSFLKQNFRDQEIIEKKYATTISSRGIGPSEFYNWCESYYNSPNFQFFNINIGGLIDDVSIRELDSIELRLGLKTKGAYLNSPNTRPAGGASWGGYMYPVTYLHAVIIPLESGRYELYGPPETVFVTNPNRPAIFRCNKTEASFDGRCITSYSEGKALDPVSRDDADYLLQKYGLSYSDLVEVTQKIVKGKTPLLMPKTDIRM